MSAIPPNTVTVRLICNSGPLTAALDELAALAVDAPDPFVERLLGVADRLGDFVRLDQDLPAASAAGEVTFALKPTEFLDRLVATARAGEFDLSVFDHEFSSAGCVGTPSEDRAPAESQGSVGACPGNAQRGDA